MRWTLTLIVAALAVGWALTVNHGQPPAQLPAAAGLLCDVTCDDTMYYDDLATTGWTFMVAQDSDGTWLDVDRRLVMLTSDEVRQPADIVVALVTVTAINAGTDYWARGVVCATSQQSHCMRLTGWLEDHNIDLDARGYRLIVADHLPMSGTLGLHDRGTRTLWVRTDGVNGRQAETTLAHEVGHMLDHELLNDPRRASWIAARSPSTPPAVPEPWQWTERQADLIPWNEDLADVYSWWMTGKIPRVQTPGIAYDDPATLSLLGRFSDVFPHPRPYNGPDWEYDHEGPLFHPAAGSGP